MVFPLMLSACATVDARTSAAERLAGRFCAAVVANDEGAAEKLMSQDLRLAIARARQANVEFERAHPGDKPPLGDGLPLAAFPDAPQTCKPGRPDGETIAVRYDIAGAPDAGWEDRLILTGGPADGLRIADIAYAPDGSGRFSAWLAEAAREGTTQ